MRTSRWFHLSGGLVVLVAAVLATTGLIRVASVSSRVARMPADILARSDEVTLWIFSDPQCGACERLIRELPTEIRPRDFGMACVVRPPPAGSFGPWPRLVVTDTDGHPLASRSGYRPPAVIRDWLAETLARDRS